MDLMFGRLAMMDYADGQISTLSPVARVHQLLAAALEPVDSVAQLNEVAPDVYAFRLDSTETAPRLVVWRRSSSPLDESTPPRTVDLPWDSIAARCLDIFGNPHPLRLTEGQVRVDVSQTPVLISAAPI